MFRSINPITVLILTLMSIFGVAVLQLYQKFNIEEKFSHYYNNFYELRILEKDFNIFLSHSIGYSDYDKITAKKDRFERLLTELKNSDISEVYRYDFSPVFAKIYKKSMESLDILEYQKSLHSMTISKLNYLFDLHKTIENSPKIDEDEKKKVNEIVFMLVQFLNGLENTRDLEHKIIRYSNSVESENLLRFYNSSKTLFNDVFELSKLPQEYTQVNLKKSLQAEMLHLDKLNSMEVKSLQKTSLIFSILVAFLMLVLIVLHRISLGFQNSLKITSSVFENINEGIVITDENQKIIEVNNSITKIFGYTKEECIGNTPHMLQSGSYSSHFYKRMWREIAQNGSWQGKINDLAKDGSIISSWMSINAVKNSYGEVINYIAIHRDLSAIVKSQERVDFLAFHDSLTKLPNRVSFEENLVTSIKYAKRHETVIAILFIDLDRFKIINDSLGHDVGDKLLIEVAQRLKGSIRELDSLARIGGDEFVVTLENTNSYIDISKVARKILTNLSLPFKIDGYALNTSASIGISQYPSDATDAITLVKYADSAMYEAKENGKNRFSFFTDKMSDSINNKLKIEQNLRKALQNNELYLNFQPQYLLKSKKVIAAEALLRWNSSELGIIGPDIFIPIAEESGLIKDIGYFVFRESCTFMKELRDGGIFLEQIAVNVSSVQFGDSDIVEQFLKIVSEYGLTPDLIEIEITERYIMESSEYNISILDTLKEKGFKISIDDFGTGYSSMSYIKNLPLDTLKIDKSFVDDLAHSRSDRAIAKAIITLTNSLEHHCVAEGIETKEQEDFLEQEGCEIGQGYYFSKPLDKETFLTFIKSIDITEEAKHYNI